MTEQELIDSCVNNSIDLADGENNDTKGWFLRWRSRDKTINDDEVSFLEADKLDGLTWPQVHKCVVGGRDVQHMTRVVGYMSRVANWNPSKHGELKDRHAGNYAVGEIK